MSLIRSRLPFRCKTIRPGCAHLSWTSKASAKAKGKPTLPPPEQRIELPPYPDWPGLFPAVQATRNRVSICNSETAQRVAETFVPSGSRGRVIIEAFPGPGQLTRALLKLPKNRIERLIVLEDAPNYLEWLRPLEQADSRVKILPMTGMDWESYDVMEREGLLEGVREHPWDGGVHPQLQFVSHLTANVYGEQLLSQYLRLIPDRQWLFKYGRVPLHFLMNEHTWLRLTSRDLGLRCKLTAVADATVDCTLYLQDEMKDIRDHFHPKVMSGRKNPNLAFRSVSLVPKEHQMIELGDMELWDYCLRRLFVQRATPLRKSILSIGPGAQKLLEMTEGIVDPQTPPRELPMDKWAELIKAFKDWPFAPTDLSDVGIDDSEGRNHNR